MSLRKSALLLDYLKNSATRLHRFQNILHSNLLPSKTLSPLKLTRKCVRALPTLTSTFKQSLVSAPLSSTSRTFPLKARKIQLLSKRVIRALKRSALLLKKPALPGKVFLKKSML